MQPLEFVSIGFIALGSGFVGYSIGHRNGSEWVLQAWRKWIERNEL